MSAPLTADLLRACAAYLAHDLVYPSDDVLLEHTGDLRAIDAHKRAIRIFARENVALSQRMDPRVHMHRDPRVVVVARAILDATPLMLRWWCDWLQELADRPVVSARERLVTASGDDVDA